MLTAGRLPETKQIRRLVIEIGFYDEDLPELIRDIFKIAEHFDGDVPDASGLDSITGRFFRRLFILRHWGSLSWFNELYSDPINQGRMPLLYHSQNLSGKQILRIEVDGIDILFKRQ